MIKQNKIIIYYKKMSDPLENHLVQFLLSVSKKAVN